MILMRKSLVWKLAFAFIVVAILTTLLMGLMIRVTSVDRLSRFILDQQRSNLQQALADYYSQQGSWNNIQTDWEQIWSRTIPKPPSINDKPPPTQPINRDRRYFFGLTDAQGVVVMALEPSYHLGQVVPASVLKNGTTVMVEGVQVGTILSAKGQPWFNADEDRFLRRTNQALLLGIGGALIVALVVSFFLARNLTRPLQALTSAAKAITEGKLEQQVNVKSQDEIGQLADAFNHMSQEVARVNQLRRQMTADIAHDLRTPLTVIGGYIEAMRDGVLQPTPERLSLVYGEIERLQNLVGDLRMLSQADAGELSMHPQMISPRGLLMHVADTFQHSAEQNHVRLVVEAANELPEIKVDEARMMQVFSNLLSNALRYTPEGGEITLSAKVMGQQMVLSVSDNGIGIAPEELPLIFDRFHRADPSRHTETSESGLGLAIVKALVEAHGGTTSAESVEGEGTSLHIHLPVG